MGSIRRIKTKRLTRGLDQIHHDLRSTAHLSRHKNAKPAEDLPGLGRFYCVECAKWFEGEHSLVTHRRGKNHKRRVKALKEVPYSQREAEAATGLGVADHARETEKVEAEGKGGGGGMEMEVEQVEGEGEGEGEVEGA